MTKTVDYIRQHGYDSGTDGTFFQDSIEISYDNLVELFGEPDCFDNCKSDAEWIIRDSKGRIFTIYNYKNGENYCGENGIPTSKITKWNIGAHGSQGVKVFIDTIIDTIQNPYFPEN